MEFLKGRFALSVAIGAIFGALSRFYVTEFSKVLFGKDFGFYGTFFINVTGCLLIAYILTLAIENIRQITPELRLMTTTGFCGAYTTFSTYGLEANGFLAKGDTQTMFLYFFGSAVVGMICVQIGVLLARAGVPKT
ncbi:fluoride efflux transporter CrcB [Planktothrix sp. FACHB-1365]|uniref:fluoride efflux transporter CrcB n=1 Tax=Planktothrix sp. FACHB-1365 TaxID=2692855 RepID=UPI001688BDE4|nr:fluoride efflux transporter CrcB [Planktothrix sp. FACHB-1365]MBD2484876.1 fluoride efflux transporter CrcB [Planktothrix sp. FACHB-1365]